MAINTLHDLHPTLPPGSSLLTLASKLILADPNFPANSFQVTKHDRLSLTSRPLCTCSPHSLFSNNQLLHDLLNSTEMWTPLGILPHLFLLLVSSLRSPLPLGSWSTPTIAHNYDTSLLLLNTELPSASTCQDFVLTPQCAAHGQGQPSQRCWMYGGRKKWSPVWMLT